ncbi:unnamed protein product [Acanthoscelides obtectus]|uniref:Uncharacterized protein n=1 Tax=Acanthoscelides obtectus TaxID=200917 RepID=A0A9P0K070_ACAOB|nr:unnamed protein product [Acanthoscelides obtectus]CAK1625224.1 hypothetical protein AOBTE_LOCUS3043 [Acanthoscelides obtectus]
MFLFYSRGGGVSVSAITSNKHHRFKSRQQSFSSSSTEHTSNPIAAAVRRRMPLARRQSVAAGGCTVSGGACHQPGITQASVPSFFPHHPPRKRIPNATVAQAISGFGGRAMRYYRLWIYTCNTCLLAGALAFAAAAARTVLFDFRRQLVPQLALYQPSFLYAYLALVTQGGALQLLGCVAALRLSEKLLNAYWLLLLVLLFGDLVLGAFWAFRFERICQELRPALRLKFAQDYGSDEELEAESSCCGVTGPADYNSTFVQLPLPASCCLRPPEGGTSYVISPTPSLNGNASAVASAQPVTCEHHQHGCDDTILAYLRATASLLAILGFCVLAFLKMCFLELELPNANGAVPSCLIQHAPASGGGGLLRHANDMRAAAAAAAAAAANTQTMYRKSRQHMTKVSPRRSVPARQMGAREERPAGHPSGRYLQEADPSIWLHPFSKGRRHSSGGALLTAGGGTARLKS